MPAPPVPRLSVVIPCLDEGTLIRPALRALQPLRTQGCELLLVDGGSRDGSLELAAGLVDCLLKTAPGRARQMNAGASRAAGEVLWFLHLDSQVPADAPRLIRAGLARSGRGWGRFDIRLSGERASLRLVAAMMNLRSRLSGIATGDQGIFMRRDWFQSLGGYAEIPLMEDIELSRRCKRRGPPVCIREPLVTSSRRWERHGVWRTVALMWRLRLAYFLGADPARLARLYRPCASPAPES
jgi:rSAM/selenodomain-associated transferase 2